MMNTSAEEAESLLGAIASIGQDITNPVLAVLKRTGHVEKLIKFLKGAALDAAEFAVETIEKIYPIMMAGLSALTVITTEDY